MPQASPRTAADRGDDRRQPIVFDKAIGVSCCILARPTKKIGLNRQMIGRVLRPAEGKTDAIVLDHSGAVFRHGFVEDPVEWTLDPDRAAESAVHKSRGNGSTGPSLLEC